MSWPGSFWPQETANLTSVADVRKGFIFLHDTAEERRGLWDLSSSEKPEIPRSVGHKMAAAALPSHSSRKEKGAECPWHAQGPTHSTEQRRDWNPLTQTQDGGLNHDLLARAAKPRSCDSEGTGKSQPQEAALGTRGMEELGPGPGWV